MAKVVPALCGAHLVDEALLAADSIDDPELRSRALASAAVHLARSGDVPRAVDTAVRAQAAAGDDPRGALMERIAWLAPAVARTGQAELAVRVMDAGEKLAVESAGNSAAQELLQALTEARAGTMDYEGAERSARTVARPEALAAALATVADVSSASNRIPAALLLAEEALSQLESADAVPYRLDLKYQVLGRTALAFGRSGQLGRAGDTVLRIDSIEWRAWFILKMIRAVLPVGNPSLTREWMSEVEDSAATSEDQDTKDWTLACAAESRAITGLHGDATRLALQIVDPAPRSCALAAIAAELHRQGERAEPLRLIQEAEVAAGEIEDTDELVFALTSVAEALTSTGDIARARRVIAKALASAPSRDALSALSALAPEALTAVTHDILATLEPDSGPLAT